MRTRRVARGEGALLLVDGRSLACEVLLEIPIAF